MKPQLQIPKQARSSRGETSRTGLRSTLPVTDCHYLGTTHQSHGRNHGLKLAAPRPAPSFHKLGNHFIGSEMKRNYVAEAAFFAVIVAVSTWPIVSMIRAMAELAK